MVQQVPHKRKHTQGLTNDGGGGEGFPSPFFPPVGHLSQHQQSTPKRGRNLVQVSKLRPLFGAQLGIYERRLRRWGEKSREGNKNTPLLWECVIFIYVVNYYIFRYIKREREKERRKNNNNTAARAAALTLACGVACRATPYPMQAMKPEDQSQQPKQESMRQALAG